MGPNVYGCVRQAVSRLGGLMKETLAGALLGAAGGLAFGVLFGMIWWVTSGAAQAVPASGWAGLWAAAGAGGAASFANMWFGGEPIGWGELVASRRKALANGVTDQTPTAPAYEGDLIIRTNGEVTRAPASPPK
jgi:hypothetical protein